jgi:hypothetical protein
MARRFAFLSALVVVGIALACSKGSKGLSVSTRTSADAPAGPAATSLDLGNGIVIERIRMVVREVEVEGGDAACPDDGSGGPGAGTMQAKHDGGDDDAEHEDGESGEDCDHGLEFGPFLVDVAGADLSGAVTWAFDVPVPAGTYDEIEIEVNTLPAGKAGLDEGLAAMADLHASIAVDVTVDGEPFLYTVPMELEQEKEGAFVVDDATAPNLTLDFDPSGWFGGTGDARLDPRDPEANGAIRANIRASIRLDRDDDHDGCDDDGHDDRCDGHDDGDDDDGGRAPGPM